MQPALAFNQSVFQPSVTYGSGYGQQYFMGRNHVIYQHQMANKFGAGGFSGHMHDQFDFESQAERAAEERQSSNMLGLNSSDSSSSAMNMQFEDEFYSRA